MRPIASSPSPPHTAPAAEASRRCQTRIIAKVLPTAAAGEGLGLGCGVWHWFLSVRCDFTAGVGLEEQEWCSWGRVGVYSGTPGSDPISCCPDINECLRFGTCSQLCNNTKGSHVCSCSKNFMKTDNMCKAEGQEETGTHMGSMCPGPRHIPWSSCGDLSLFPPTPCGSAHPSGTAGAISLAE